MVFTSERINILLTPFQAPNANAFAERWVRSVRQECLDHVHIINEQHLRRVLNEYVAHYNMARPHHGVAQQTPISRPASSISGPVERRDILGGIIHEYYRAVAQALLPWMVFPRHTRRANNDKTASERRFRPGPYCVPSGSLHVSPVIGYPVCGATSARKSACSA